MLNEQRQFVFSGKPQMKKLLIYFKTHEDYKTIFAEHQLSWWIVETHTDNEK